jgi:cytochrome c oxidase subunit II
VRRASIWRQSRPFSRLGRALRRGAILALIAIGVVVAAATTAIAYFVPWLPEQASEERGRIDAVFWITTAICIFVFAVVAAVSIYAGVKFRVRPDDDSDGPPIHGHTGIEIVWTVVPTILVAIILVASTIALGRNDRPNGIPLRVDVLAQQFAWQFTYPEQGNVVATNLYLPVGRSTRLVLQARDVIHSFWVPEFGQKQDAVPGITTTVIVTPTRTGEYRLICTELCGLGHALMRTRAIVLSQGEFDAWAAERQEALGTGGDEDADEGEQVFASAGCGGCHIFEPAGGTGNVGPPLDDLELSPEETEQVIRHGRDGMPAFGDQLTDAQIDALVQYLTEQR